MSNIHHRHGIAIVGMSCRFPMVRNPEEFWNLLAAGKSVFSIIPNERISKHSLDTLAEIKGAFLKNPFSFDNQFFGIPNSEALFMDPQQRIMLELAVSAMEDAGFSEWRESTTAVFVGANHMSHVEMITSRWYRQKAWDHLLSLPGFREIPLEYQQNLEAEIERLKSLDPLPPHAMADNLSNMIASRISHELNLLGPSLSVDTACSSSLVAVHLACESLYRNECDMALAGGINLNLSPSIFQYMQAAGVISPSGTCIPFSKESDGILLGEGAGMVCLKRLEDAVQDHDPIWAVIRGSGINNDGRSMGLMAPAWKGQLRLLQQTYTASEFDPVKISALEAHGTSTRIGDGVELSVIEQFFPHIKKKPISVGSVKSNIGHTLAAAGIAGLIKMTLAISKGQLLPSLHDSIDPNKKLAEKGIRIQSGLEDWESNDLRAAGISSFGFGGTNAHVILEQYKSSMSERPVRPTTFNQRPIQYDFFPQAGKNESVLHTLNWARSKIALPAKEYAPDHWLLVGYSDKALGELGTCMAKEGKSFSIIQLRIQENEPHFVRMGPQHFQLDAPNPEHYEWLLKSLNTDHSLGLIYLSQHGGQEALHHKILHGQLSGLRYLIKSLKGWDNDVKIWVYTVNAYCLSENLSALEDENGNENGNGNGKIQPSQRAISVLACAALEEHPALRGGVIDMADLDAEQVIDLAGRAFEQVAIYRGAHFFQARLRLLKKKAPLHPRIKKEGLYLILGGTSGIGPLIAQYLVEAHACKVVISGRRPKNQLPEIIHKLPSEHWSYIACDVRQKAQVEQLIHHICQDHGSLDGIIYAPGYIRFGSLTQSPQVDFERTLSTKITGLNHLLNSLDPLQPDFIFLMSSISALSPKWLKGMGAYAAANAYMDALAESKSNSPTTIIACSWGRWQNIGIAATAAPEESIGLTAQQGLAAFVEAIEAGEAHILACSPEEKQTFDQRFSAAKARKKNPKTPFVGQGNSITTQSPERNIELPTPRAPEIKNQDFTLLLSSYIAEATELEISEIDVHESFYQFGLDSLSAVDVAQRIEVEIGIKLHPTLLFEYDTIHSLGNYLNQLQSGHAEPNKITKDESNSLDTHKAKRFPLIGAQKTFFAQQHFYPDRPCNMLVNLQVDFAPNPIHLQAAWDYLGKKHDTLRLTFEMTDSGARQFVKPYFQNLVQFQKLEKGQEILDLENEFVNQSFDLEKPPFYQLVCVTAKSEHAIMLLMHHIIGDAWSLYLLMKELLELYQSLQNGAKLPPISEDPQFSQYVALHEAELTKKDLPAIQNYWTNKLDQATWSIPLPYRNPVGPRGQYRVASGRLSKVATARLMKHNQVHALSDFQTMLAALFLTLYQQCGQEDMIIRVAQSNRDIAFEGINQLTGCLADAIPVRVILGPDSDLISLAKTVKKQLLASLKYAKLSSQDIADLPIRRKDDSPLVLSPVGMSYVPIHHLSKNKGPAYQSLSCRTALPFTDFSLICFVDQGQVNCCWNYELALFEPETMEALNQGFLKNLENINGVNRIWPDYELPRVQLFPENKLIHEKVWAACEQFANAPAIWSEMGSITFAELAVKSKKLSFALKEKLEAETEAVAIFAYPGIPAVLGILGILGAGKAFIPIDPDWPEGRIEKLISHSGVGTILCSQVHTNRLNAYCQQFHRQGIQIVEIEKASLHPTEGKPESFSPEQLAYIMYTSGTSGNPKGVMVPHKAVEVFLNWISETFGIHSQDRFVHTSSLGFGGSIRQIFSTLLAGACLYPIPRVELKDPQSLLRFLKNHEITLLNTVPSVINNLLDLVVGENRVLSALKKLRYILLGGEALYVQTVKRWQECFGSESSIANLYGSTETIVNATMFNTATDPLPDRGVVPIGFQKKGSVVRLFNEQGVLCNVGEPGEIYVSGDCLANGYYKSEGLTAQKFVELSLPKATGRFYRTGDLGKMDERGMIHFMGRNDDQIQVYGNRVELTEIEDAIYQTQQVKSTAVVDYKTDQQHWLVAFVECKQSAIQLNPQQVRQFIAHRLPGYMVPHKVLIIDKMPFNQAGKTDRKALRQKLKQLFEESNSGIRPAEKMQQTLTPTEQIIAEIWKNQLQIQHIHPEDDFFELGGDSIRVLAMFFQLKKHFNRLPKAVSLFRNRSLSALAKAIDALQDEAVQSGGSDKLPTVGNKNPLSATQRGFVLLQKLNPTSSPNWAGLIRMSGDIRPVLFKEVIQVLMDRHSMLRTVFVREGLQNWQEVRPIPEVPVEVFDISSKTKEQQTELLQNALEALQNKAFDLSQLPLFRIQMFQLDTHSAVLALCMHHIITDGWSTHVLIQDLLRVYDALVQGVKPDFMGILPAYPAITKLQNEATKEIEKTKLRQFWENSLSTLAHSDFQYEGQQQSESIHLILNPSQKSDLIEWSKGKGVSLYISLLSIASRSLATLYELEDFLINTALSGRDIAIAGIEEVVACFARNLPLRMQIRPGQALEEMLPMVESTFLEAMEHQEISPTEIFQIANKAGGTNLLFAMNRFYFSFMDFNSLEKYPSKVLNLHWEESTFVFNAGGAGSEIMFGVEIGEQARISLNGFASLETKLKLKALLLYEIQLITKDNNPFRPKRTIDTALIAYLPGLTWLQKMLPTGISVEMVQSWKKKIFPNHQPTLIERTQTEMGSSGLIFLADDADHLSSMSSEQLNQRLVKAIELAGEYGAKQVSLAGVLPAMTQYGFAVQKQLDQQPEFFSKISLTSGHACTVVAVVKTVAMVLAQLQVPIEKLNLAVLGFGSIGQSALTLLLRKLGQPASLCISDLESHLPMLLEPLTRIKSAYHGKLNISLVKEQEVSSAVYAADLIIGASSTGHILTLSKFRPGSILVDDSFPPVVDSVAGILRMKTAQDLLLLGGGKLSAPNQNRQLLSQALPEHIIQSLIQHLGDQGMPGCRLEPLVLHASTELSPVKGWVDLDHSIEFWKKIEALGIEAAPLHLGGFNISDSYIQQFRNKYWQD